MAGDLDNAGPTYATLAESGAVATTRAVRDGHTGSDTEAALTRLPDAGDRKQHTGAAACYSLSGGSA